MLAFTTPCDKGAASVASSIKGQRIWRRPSHRKPIPPCTKTKMTTALRRRWEVAEDDPARGAEALRSIVADEAFDPDTRLEAALRMYWPKTIQPGAPRPCARSWSPPTTLTPTPVFKASVQAGRSRRATPGRRGPAQHRGRLTRSTPTPAPKRRPEFAEVAGGPARSTTTAYDPGGFEPNGGKPNSEVERRQPTPCRSNCQSQSSAGGPGPKRARRAGRPVPGSPAAVCLGPTAHRCSWFARWGSSV